VPTIVATVGAANANSYATTTEAAAYFTDRLQVSAWATNADDQARALIMATRRLDQFEFRGTKTTTTQALKWPRVDTFDEDGEEYATNAIPTFVKHATFEQALAFLKANAEAYDPLAGDGLDRFDSVKIGPLAVEIGQSQQSTALAVYAHRLIRHVLASSGLVATLERM
jgi:hypothetical protein